MAAGESDRLLRLCAAEALVELNAQQPSLAAKLPPPWNARLQASIPPIVAAPAFALRKPPTVVFSLADYVEKGILSPARRDTLVRAVHAHDNILIGGGTGTGKTTFGNALLKVIAEGTDRVLIIEDTPERARPLLLRRTLAPPGRHRRPEPGAARPRAAAIRLDACRRGRETAHADPSPTRTGSWPMNTAVQLRPIAAADLSRCDLLHGAPIEILAGDLGPVALFAPDALVAYPLRSLRRIRLYVFRTLDTGDLAATVPGVRPRVHLLLELRSATRVRLAQKLFAYLARAGREPADLGDVFYLRVGAVLAGRLPAHKVLLSLLSAPNTGPAPSPRGSALALVEKTGGMPK
jgi:hypothetical protein